MQDKFPNPRVMVKTLHDLRDVPAYLQKNPYIHLQLTMLINRIVADSILQKLNLTPLELDSIKNDLCKNFKESAICRYVEKYGKPGLPTDKQPKSKATNQGVYKWFEFHLSAAIKDDIEKYLMGDPKTGIDGWFFSIIRAEFLSAIVPKTTRVKNNSLHSEPDGGSFVAFIERTIIGEIADKHPLLADARFRTGVAAFILDTLEDEQDEQDKIKQYVLLAFRADILNDGFEAAKNNIKKHVCQYIIDNFDNFFERYCSYFITKCIKNYVLMQTERTKKELATSTPEEFVTQEFFIVHYRRAMRNIIFKNGIDLASTVSALNEMIEEHSYRRGISTFFEEKAGFGSEFIIRVWNKAEIHAKAFTDCYREKISEGDILFHLGLIKKQYNISDDAHNHAISVFNQQRNEFDRAIATIAASEKIDFSKKTESNEEKINKFFQQVYEYIADIYKEIIGQDVENNKAAILHFVIEKHFSQTNIDYYLTREGIFSATVGKESYEEYVKYIQDDLSEIKTSPALPIGPWQTGDSWTTLENPYARYILNRTALAVTTRLASEHTERERFFKQTLAEIKQGEQLLRTKLNEIQDLPYASKIDESVVPRILARFRQYYYQELESGNSDVDISKIVSRVVSDVVTSASTFFLALLSAELKAVDFCQTSSKVDQEIEKCAEQTAFKKFQQNCLLRNFSSSLITGKTETEIINCAIDEINFIRKFSRELDKIPLYIMISALNSKLAKQVKEMALKEFQGKYFLKGKELDVDRVIPDIIKICFETKVFVKFSKRIAPKISSELSNYTLYKEVSGVDPGFGKRIQEKALAKFKRDYLLKAKDSDVDKIILDLAKECFETEISIELDRELVKAEKIIVMDILKPAVNNAATVNLDKARENIRDILAGTSQPNNTSGSVENAAEVTDSKIILLQQIRSLRSELADNFGNEKKKDDSRSLEERFVTFFTTVAKVVTHAQEVYPNGAPSLYAANRGEPNSDGLKSSSTTHSTEKPLSLIERFLQWFKSFKKNKSAMSAEQVQAPLPVPTSAATATTAPAAVVVAQASDLAPGVAESKLAPQPTYQSCKKQTEALRHLLTPPDYRPLAPSRMS